MEKYYNHLTKEELIGYCREHCKSDRALFRKEMIAQMIEYAGRPREFCSPEEIMGDLCGWYSMHYDMKELVDLARETK